jgi:hypothetical protein
VVYAPDTVTLSDRWHADADADWTVVSGVLRQRAGGGLAEWIKAPKGDIELTLCSGEVYLLDKVGTTRTT